MAFSPAQTASGPASPASQTAQGPSALPTAPAPILAPRTPSGIPCLPRPQLQLSPVEVKEWWGRVRSDRARRELESPAWKQLYHAYRPPPYGADVTDLNSNIHFRNVHLKQSELWVQYPELILTPNEPLKEIPQIGPDGRPLINPQTQQPQMASPDDIVAIKRAILNKELGRDGANVDLLIQQVTFDLFMTAGIGPSKICYESDVSYPPAEAAAPVPGAVLGLSQPPVPQPVVVNERRRWYHFSPEKLLIPAGFLSTDWDHAPYLAMEFETPCTDQAKKAYHLPDDFLPSSSSLEKNLSADADRNAATTAKFIKGIEIWLHAAEFDVNEPNQDVFYRLVLIEGLKDTAPIYELSPYQDKDPQGRLTTDSMIGNPIHPFCLRVASDTAWVPSDAAFTNPLVNIENLHEKVDAQLREANIPRFIAPVSALDAIDKARAAGTGQGIGIDDALVQRFGDKIIVPLPHLERAQSDIQGREHNRQAITETLGLGANQAGAMNSTRKSATEIATVQANVSARLQGERNTLLSRYLQGVRKFDSLIQRYLTDQGYVQIVGTDGLHRLMAYTQAHLAGRFAYDALPDAQLTQDQDSRIKRATDYVNFMAKSPASNQMGMARKVANAFGFDPAEVLQPPPPPPPDKPNVTYSFKGEDVAIPEVRAILALAYPQLAPILNAPISPEALAAHQAAQAKAEPHGGGQPLADTVSKHKADETGHQVGTPPLAGQIAHTPAPAVPRMI